jgi:hypothetical protein
MTGLWTHGANVMVGDLAQLPDATRRVVGSVAIGLARHAQVPLIIVP